MGRRKERRLAAMSGAGRRVKLDLFAEPSGDLGGSSTLEEVGGNEILAESISPSASGQKPQNPLQLLGQYSDEELDEDTNEGHNHAEDSSVGIVEESKNAAGKEAEDGEINHAKEFSQKVEQILMDDSAASQGPPQNFEKESIKEISPADLKMQTNNTEEATYPAAPDEHIVEDVSGWKMVLHEESNEYYYWNVLTGETSWEVPDVLAQEIGTSAEKVIRDTEEKMDILTSTYKSSVPLDVEEDDITTRDAYSKINSKTADSADQRIRMDGSDEGLQSDSIEDKEGNGDAIQDNRSFSVGGDSQSGVDLSLQLIERCKSLLERLNSVQCLNCSLEGQDLKLKCKMEIEIRLSDINILASHGSSLHPFWLHSESQLERLESAVDSVIQQVNSAAVNEFLATLEPHEGASDDTEIDSSEKKALFAAVEPHAGDTSVKPTAEAHSNGVTTTEHVPLVWNSSTYSLDNVGGSEITGTENGSDLNPKPADHAVDDVDMDVDMEVEDASPIKSARGGEPGAHHQISTDLPHVHATLSNGEPTLPGQVFGVHPPTVEWIPPPPPDNEPFPPPPPDDEPFPPPPPEEPPETSNPPSHLGSVQAFPYSEQYTLSYLGSGLEYYVQTNPELSGAALYTHPEGGQVAPSHVPQYYEASSNLYAVTPVVVNPIEPTTYYGLENGTFNPTSLMNSEAGSSGIKSEPVREEIGAAGSLSSRPESESNLLLKTNINADKSCQVNVKASREAPEAQSSTGAPETSETTTSVSAAAAAAAIKAQSKVSRKKKRTVAVVSTLRSNKKVSSLVDKWKAAKEELHEEEEEEEPEDPYEILEMKRKREIEKWKAQQIASGEAKDNANFQPLGGDWRERVKRRRAAKMKESARSSPDVATDGNQQTDLLELSKGLPSGWQAYWDDSSKLVYYGNALTSETTWIRPSD
ncbi:hypothetical protein ACS0TY_033289 [Phlomoides rotata]